MQPLRKTGTSMACQKILGVFLFLSLCCFSVYANREEAQTVEAEEVDAEDLKRAEYTKGSLCSYCDYCKFCKLCDEDCPCEVSPTKPNCHMCKYCKFCYLCSGLCNTICQPGGIIDKVSAALVNALPSYNKEEVDSDIEGVKVWIDKKKDEL